MAIATVMPSLDAHVTQKSLPAGGFDPNRHLHFKQPSRVYTMDELGLGGQRCTSNVAITDPFPLVSRDGIRAMRAEILQPDVIDEYAVHSKLSAFQIRGMSAAYTPFLHQFWKHPATLAAVSQAAGLDLVPIMDFELAHTNIMVKKGSTREDTLASLTPEPLPAHPPLDSELSDASESDEDDVPAVVGWHKDSYPWVCVLMLSDVSNMRGGETAIRTGYGSIIKVRGPQLGTAVMMQGKYIEHCALPALGSSERLTMVCSFRAKEPTLPDDSHLVTVLCNSNWNDLFYQWTAYRLRLLSERFSVLADTLDARATSQDSVKAGGPPRLPVVNLEEFELWMQEQIAYLRKTRTEMDEYAHAPSFVKVRRA